jgi:hypothetical protein
MYKNQLKKMDRNLSMSLLWHPLLGSVPALGALLFATFLSQ